MDKTIDDFCGVLVEQPEMHWEVHFSTADDRVMYLTHPHKFVQRGGSVNRRIITPYQTAAQRFKERESAVKAMNEKNWAGKETYSPQNARLVRIEKSKSGTVVSRLEYTTSLKGNQVSKTDAVRKTEKTAKMVHPKKKSDETQRMMAVCGVKEDEVEKTKEATPPPLPPPAAPLLPKAVKSSTSSTSTTSKPMLPQPASPPAGMSTMEAKKILAKAKTEAATVSEKSTTPNSSTDQAVIQEWTAKIRRITRDTNKSGSGALDKYYAEKSILLREHVITSAIAFIPKAKKMSRIRTIMKMLGLGTAAAKALYDNVGNLIPHIEHPEFNKITASAVIPPRTLYSLQKQIDELKKVREELNLEIKAMDWEIAESRESCVAIAAEALKVFDFIKTQFEEAYNDEDYAEKRSFGFMFRVLSNEITTFTKAHAEAEAQRDGPVNSNS